MSFVAAQFDGILGLAFETISADECVPVFQLAFQQGAVSDNSFSFYLTAEAGADGSAMVLGGVDEEYYTGDFNYHEIISDTYYLIGLDSVALGDNVFNSTTGLKGIVDTGTSVIVGTTALVNAITASLPAITCDNISTLPNLLVTIDGIQYTIPPSAYVLQVSMMGEEVCELGIMSMDLPPEWGDTMILGDTFIKTYYTHFDIANNKVGFALAK